LNVRRLCAFTSVICLLLATGGNLEGCAPLSIKTRKGITHTVKHGETLWRICYVYQANMQTVCRFNKIKDPAQLEAGERIFIPGAEKILEVGPQLKKNRQHTKKTIPQNKEKEYSGVSSDRKKTASKKPLPGVSFAWPLKGPVTSWFGIRKGRKHDGIDIAAPKGTPIRAAEKGKVIYSDNGIKGYGNLVILKHNSGFSTVYAHNSINLVSVDDTVQKGKVIGEVGDTGRARGAHLHFEIRKGIHTLDPMEYLP